MKQVKGNQTEYYSILNINYSEEYRTFLLSEAVKTSNLKKLGGCLLQT